MDRKEKIDKEIARLKELIKGCEKAMEQLPEYMRKNQEIVLNICRKELTALELELMKS